MNMKTKYSFSCVRNVGFTLGAAAALFLPGTVGAQSTLFVADNEFTTQIENMQTALTAAGVTYTTYNVADNGGAPPTFSQLDAYSTVIWYTGTDGTELAFWFAENDIRNYAQTGKKLWIIGQDLLYAVYAAPTTFSSGDFPYDIMGIETYGVQAYGDDGNTGCPQMDVDAGVSSFFAPTLNWIFETLWWADGCVLLDGITPIYNMGPSSYILNGFTSMFRNSDPGLFNVVSTLFEPTYISTPAGTATLIQQTLAYMNFNVGMNEADQASAQLRFSSNPATDRVEVLASSPLSSVQVFSTDGRLMQTLAGINNDRVQLELDGYAHGIYVVSARGLDGSMMTARLVKE
jgi:hypothetical protein